MQTIPVQRQTVDMNTGKVEKTDTVQFQIMPAPNGTCAECAKDHDPDHPHNAQSLHYQYVFYGREGRWPTWKDAMAHCSPEMQAAWTEALEDAGVDVEGGKINPELESK